MIRFKATEEEVRQIAVNAIKASKPVSQNAWTAEIAELTALEQPSLALEPAEIKVQVDGIFYEYYQGRSVKLRIYQVNQQVWEIPKAITEFQSWAATYPTTEALILSVLGRERLVS